MSNIVSFKKPDPLVWVCSGCGCSTFKLYEDGTTECASCEARGGDHGEWVRELPEPKGPVRDVLPDSKVISFSDLSPEAALRSMLQRVDAENLCALVALETNGRVRTWGGIDTDERREWLDRRLEEARDLLTIFAPKERP